MRTYRKTLLENHFILALDLRWWEPLAISDSRNKGSFTFISQPPDNNNWSYSLLLVKA